MAIGEKTNAKEDIKELLSCSFIILDKPKGPSTHEITSFVRKLLGAKKAGQMGTLDPQASGVIVIGIGKATRLLRFLDMKIKKYVGVIRLKNKPKGIKELEGEFSKYIGEVIQVPPKESSPAKRARKRKIYQYRVLELSNNTALFEAHVEAGTYIRVLCQEAGEAFGGGKMIELRRIAAGSFDESNAVRLPDLVDAVWKFKMRKDASDLQKMLIPAQKVLKLACLKISGEAAEALGRGAPLAASDVAGAEALEKGSFAQAIDNKGRLVAIVQKVGEKIFPRTVIRAAGGKKENKKAGIA